MDPRSQGECFYEPRKTKLHFYLLFAAIQDIKLNVYAFVFWVTEREKRVNNIKLRGNFPSGPQIPISLFHKHMLNTCKSFQYRQMPL